MALTQETQLLKLAQVSGSTVGICVVGTTLVVVVGTSVTLGARVVMLGCAAETQSTARQVAAQSSRREEPDFNVKTFYVQFQENIHRQLEHKNRL